MAREDKTIKEIVIEQTKATGILPCIKLKAKDDLFIAYAKAMYEGGARVIEITMTTPGALEAIEAIAAEFKGRLWVAAGDS
jgi:2-keto-3-deoxy-6-phosphogluconate aldolase